MQLEEKGRISPSLGGILLTFGPAKLIDSEHCPLKSLFQNM
jgi:hypothetical protein